MGKSSNMKRRWSDPDYRESMSGENAYWYGKKRSKETKRKISDVSKGKKLSEETKKKLSKLRKGKKHINKTKQKIGDANRGKKRSEETKQKLREIMKDKNKGKNNPNWKENYEELGLVGKHKRMRRILEEMGIFESEICPKCGKKPRIENMHLMNLDHEYRNNPNEWFYMCNYCHKIYHSLAGLGGKIGIVTIKPIPNLIKNLLQLKNREEREQLLKEVILKSLIKEHNKEKE